MNFKNLLLPIAVIIIFSACKKIKSFEYRNIKNVEVKALGFNQSALSLDLIYYNPNEFGVDFKKPVAILIQHPVTTENKKSYFQIKTTLEAVKSLDLQVVIIMPNNDAGYSNIIKGIRSSKIKAYPNLSAEKYGNLLRYSSILIGNSSSGIHEAATFKIPVINIGNRQQGREKGMNVIDVPHDKEKIIKAIKKALYSKSFKNKLQKVKNPYGDGNSTKKIVKVLKEIELKGVIQKKFYE